MDLRLRTWLSLTFVIFSCYLKVTEAECLDKNTTLYYINAGSLVEKVEFNAKGDVYGRYYQYVVNIVEIKSIDYESKYKELLFTHKQAPNYISGMSDSIGIHTVVHQPDITFDSIVVDQSTGNIYYTQNGKGIGVCSGHGPNSICTLLIDESNNPETAIYDDLTLYSKMGVMFWIQGDSSSDGSVKMASMDGTHIREIGSTQTCYGLALDAENGDLYMSGVQFVKKFNLETHSIQYTHLASLKKILYFNCRLYSIDRNVDTKLVTFNQSPYTLKQHAYHSTEKRATKFTSSVVWNNDKSRENNQCKEIDCNGICVIAESFPTPKPKCIKGKDSENTNSENSLLCPLIIIACVVLLLLGSTFLINYFGLWPSICDRFTRMTRKETNTDKKNEPAFKVAGV